MEGANVSLHNEIISTTKREALGVIATIKHFQPYLLHVVSCLPNKQERTSLQFPQLVKQFFVARQFAKRGCHTRNFVRSLSRNGVAFQVTEKKIARLTTPFDRRAVFSCR